MNVAFLFHWSKSQFLHLLQFIAIIIYLGHSWDKSIFCKDYNNTTQMDYCSYLFSRVRKYFVLASSLLHLSKDSSLNTVFSLTREKQGQIISCNDNNREKVFELSNKTKITFYVIVLFVLLLWLNPFTFFITFFIHF